jgi:hypothetical protein
MIVKLGRFAAGSSSFSDRQMSSQRPQLPEPGA